MTENYGAARAKIMAIMGRRVKPEQFRQMAGMQSVSQVAAYIKSHPAWKDILKNVNEADIHRGQLEPLLWQGLYDEFDRILKYFPEKDRELYEYQKIGIETSLILAFVRQLNNGQLSRLADTIRIAAPYTTHLDINALLSAETFAQMTEAARKCGFFNILQRYEPENGGQIDYTQLEIALDGYLYRYIDRAIEKNYTGARKKLLLDTFGMLVDMNNITRVIRIRRYFSKENEDFYAYLIPLFYKTDVDFFKTLASLQSAEDGLAYLKESPYAKIFPDVVYDHPEQYADEYYVCFFDRLIHNTPDNVLLPLAFLMMKSYEIRNLIHVIECVRYHVPPEKLDDYIVWNRRKTV